MTFAPGVRFYTVREVAEIFRKNQQYVYRHSIEGGFLYPFARRFGAKSLLFHRQSLDRYLENPEPEPQESA